MLAVIGKKGCTTKNMEKSLHGAQKRGGESMG